MTVINPKVLNFFERRRIDPELVARIGICSVTPQSIGDPIPDAIGEVIEFPYIRDGKKVGAKYRAAGKRFWQRPNSIKSFINSDVLSDPALRKGDVALIITEGEIDMLTAIQCGFPHTVSVPDGAPPENFQPGDALPEPGMDTKFSYVALDWERLKLIQRIIIAVDNDAPGKRLAEELVRRLGRVRCMWVEYPEGCKDLNEVLMNYGPEEVTRVLNTTKSYFAGVYKWKDRPKEPALIYLGTGWVRMDDLLRVFYPGLMIVTGFANAGKSTWVNQLVAQLALNHGWVTGIASFEMRLDPYVSDTLRTVRLKKPKQDWTPEDYALTEDWINDYFPLISPTDDDDNHDIDWLIEAAFLCVRDHNARVILIDPWNEIEHMRSKNENLGEYIGRALQALKSFAKRHNCLVILVTHPTKAGATKKSEDLNLYDCADSAHFANKADVGVVVKNMGDQSNLSKIIVCKVKYIPDMGNIGEIVLAYDPILRLFAE